MIGVIRVFTTDNQDVLEQHGRIITEKYGVQVISKSIPDQPLGIYDDETEEIANPKIVELGKSMEHDGCKVLIISCAADPAIDALRQSVSIPVIGAGSAASYSALATGLPVGVMGITKEAPAVVSGLLGSRLVKYLRPEGVTNTTDILTPSGREKAIEAAQSLIDQGAKVIQFACTGFSTIGLADVLRNELRIPVIDSVEAEGLYASSLYLQTVTDNPIH
ncbi:aspartate/glutamate racemase family protein [Paenibacillus medicaginis]|uniref:Aspartate/glutamate racemase family protein n=1 Tax=Paenibacillus medicaginis TaxID=1470560 RepID=A0ABV5BXV8_9BACL